ncbi:MAG: class I SAM-dependent methyltransferase [Flavobacteriaceae bacterium]|nr:class I SAM-dependent methyltransferase [Flavobacteriaceae bacterium]
MNTSTDWFASWFDTDFYHILYKNRDDKEAQLFMTNLVSFLELKKGAKILDLACGKGRHSVFLNSLGFDVVGADLSQNSIAFAKQYENETLEFVQHDMRVTFETKFDAIFNLFTSFGYFVDDSEDINVLKNIKNGLKDRNSFAVIDFVNINKAIKNLIVKETIHRDTITFNITRKVENGFIIKNIEVISDDESYTYFERVKCLDFEKIKAYLETVGLKLRAVFGDYNLQEYNEENSNRLLLILSR